MQRALLVGLACAVGLLLAGRTLVRADGTSAAAQVVTWANQHAGAVGMAPLPLAQALLTSGVYESGLQDVPNLSRSGAQGPFQFYGPTLATAQTQGFNIHTVPGALDAFAASGDLQLGIEAYRHAQAQGADESAAMHAFYLAMERPGANEDTARSVRGDWAAAFAVAATVAASPDLSAGVGGLAAAASRAAAAGQSQTRWPSGAVGSPGRFVGDTLVGGAGATYSWDGSTWVPVAS